MTSHFRTQGFILKKEDRGEADRVFTVFTKDFGKLVLRAVSERKITSKLRGGLELFYCSEIAFVQGKNQKTITDAVLVERFSAIQKDMRRMRLMHRIAEVTDEVFKDAEQDARIWSLFQETLNALNRPQLSWREQDLLGYYFLWNLLNCAGYVPSLETLAEKNEKTAHIIHAFLERDITVTERLSQEGANENLLKEISQEHLSKVLQS